MPCLTDEDGFRTQRGRLSHPARTAFEGRETALRQWQSGTLSMVKWYFVAKNVVLCRKKCGTLSAKMWRFNEQSGVFRLSPSFWG